MRIGLSKLTWAVSLVGFALLAAPSPAAEAPPPRERMSFNADWHFIKGDPPGVESNLSYEKLKPWLMTVGAELSVHSPAPPRPEGNPGGDVVYAQPAFDDSVWRKLNLPHDWGIEGPFKQEYPGETGKLPWWGVAWYRKHFTVASSDTGKDFYLDVDGAMAYAAVWLNGRFAGGWPYGYSSWRADLTPFIKPGADNVLAIRLDNPPASSRWYPGGGIYRNVWLVKTRPIHVGHWGTYVTTPEVSKAAAKVVLKVEVENRSKQDVEVKVRTMIYQINPEGLKIGKPIATAAPTSLRVGAGSNAMASLTTTVRQPKLWSPTTPNRYVAATTLEQNDIVDSYETPFGIRTIQFTADNGFLLNGQRLQINGVCNHHDLGPLGSAINTRALERQIELLQQMGCNAIRTSHNPPAPELLDLCDRMGMVVMDEAFDCWIKGKGKNTNDYHRLFPDWHEKDLRAMVRRDRNHPCVVLWSIGNEIIEQIEPDGGHKVAAELAGIVHEEDPTRPVTAACNHTEAGYNGFQKLVDVFGYNYRPFEYGKFREANPSIPLFGSETASTVSSRGEYFFPVSNDQIPVRANFQVSSYDLYAPNWATTPDREFRSHAEFPFVAGEFVWTGFDYLGEPTPYWSDTTNVLEFTNPQEQARAARELREFGKVRVPSRSSYFGILDLCGFKKDRFYLYQAHWRPELPMAHILPHWNWPERVGQLTPVHVYTSGDEAELFLNGKSLGRKRKSAFEYRLRWDDVTYQPGELKVVAYKNGRRWAEAVERTTGSASKLMLAADRQKLKADGQDLAYVTVSIADKSGQVVPRSNNRVVFDMSGPAELAGVCNGDATSHESLQTMEFGAYNGLFLVVLRTRVGETGTITLEARGRGLESAVISLVAR